MNSVFADTSYWIALLHQRDRWHGQALEASRRLGARMLVTTEWVLAEFLALFSASGEIVRQSTAERTRRVLNDPNIHVLSPSQATFLDDLLLYESRLDKNYSLVDCVSMQVMRREGLTEVLTNDHHFTQEGFRILFP